MGISLLNNVGVINTIRNISTIQRSLLRTQARLSSGLKINSAAEGPASLVISEKMRSQIGSIAQELANLDNNINKSNVADQAMTQLEDQLIEMRELAVGASNSATNDPASSQAYQDAANNLVSSFNQTIASSQFASQKLLDGSEGSVANIAKLENLDLSNPQSAAQAVEKIDEKLDELSQKHVEVGANTKNYLTSFRNNLETAQTNLIRSESYIRDTDYALEVTNYMNLLMQQKTGIALLAQGNLQAESVFNLLTV